MGDTPATDPTPERVQHYVQVLSKLVGMPILEAAYLAACSELNADPAGLTDAVMMTLLISRLRLKARE